MSIAAIGSSDDMALLLQQLAQQNAKHATTTTSTTGTTSANSVTGTSGTTATASDLFAQQLFSVLDTDGDGKISSEEAQAGAQKAQDLLQSLNGQNSNSIQSTESSEAVNQVFSQMDSDGDGTISKAELSSAIAQMEMQQLLQMQNGDKSQENNKTQNSQSNNQQTQNQPQQQFALLSTLSGMPFVGSLASMI